MILRLPRRWRPAVLAATAVAVTAASPRALNAHDIPSRVTVLVFVRPEAGRLRIVLRAPLEALRDVNWPSRPLGYLDLEKALPLARDAAKLWIADFIDVRENGVALDPPALTAIRLALPSERTFVTYDSALRGVLSPPLPPSVEIPWNQTLVDVVLDYGVASEHSSFAIRPQLARLGVQTTTVLRYLAPSGVERAYQYHGDPGLVQLDPRWYHAALQFVRLGIRHILSGIDHLLFVLCLVIPFRRLKPLVLIVTAFTVAHSITLTAAALGVVPGALWFPPLIEVLIAGSILYMALENIVGASVHRRWLIAFGFGLVHGFGFSFALRESLQFAGGHLAVSLATFNAGVEIGQVLVLLVAIPALSFVLERVVAERIAIVILSAFVAHTAFHWLVDRGRGLSEYRFDWPVLDAAFAVSAMRAAIVLLIAGAAVWAMAEVVRRFSDVRRAAPSAATGQATDARPFVPPDIQPVRSPSDV